MVEHQQRREHRRQKDDHRKDHHTLGNLFVLLFVVAVVLHPFAVNFAANSVAQNRQAVRQQHLGVVGVQRVDFFRFGALAVGNGGKGIVLGAFGRFGFIDVGHCSAKRRAGVLARLLCFANHAGRLRFLRVKLFFVTGGDVNEIHHIGQVFHTALQLQNLLGGGTERNCKAVVAVLQRFHHPHNRRQQFRSRRIFRNQLRLRLVGFRLRVCLRRKQQVDKAFQHSVNPVEIQRHQR